MSEIKPIELEPLPYGTDQDEAEAEFKVNALASLYRLKAVIDMWEKDHKPGVKPPMIQGQDGTYHWLNRETRRKRR